jgi:hypothetical protein
VVPIVHGPRAARLRELVERVKTLDRPVTPLDMCVTLYILGHTYPNMIDRTRGMYRPFSMYRVIGWFDRARARTDAEWGQHSARLARLECLMRAAVEFAGDTAWLIDYCKPYRLSPVDEFELTAQHGVLFRFDRADGVAYVVHLVCRFHADPYAHSIDALVDTITNERKEGKDSACLVIALDCAAPFVVRPPSDQRAILEYTRLAMRAHYARLNAEIARGIVKKRIPLYAERAIARLESIRLEWLLLLGDGAARVSSPKSEHDGPLALLRLAELHLDLAARIRRIPYPAGVDGADRAAFDAALSRLALPLEATGQGVLAQITDRAARTGADGRFVRRARLYQRLHAGHALSDADLRLVGSELVASTYRAPSTLLQAGRIGQRASR